MEDRIRKLCAEVIAESDSEKARELGQQLRAELHDFIGGLRARVSSYPVIEERRVQSGVPPPEKPPERAPASSSLVGAGTSPKTPVR